MGTLTAGRERPARGDARDRGSRWAEGKGGMYQVYEDATLVLDEVGTRVDVGPVDDALAQGLGVGRRDGSRVGQRASKHMRHADLARVQEGVRRNDRARRIVDALAHHVHTEEAYAPRRRGEGGGETVERKLGKLCQSSDDGMCRRSGSSREWGGCARVPPPKRSNAHITRGM